MRSLYLKLAAAALLVAMLPGCTKMAKPSFSDSFVRVSREDPRYFELSNGETYIPIGCNIAALDGRSSIEHYVRRIAGNGGNYGRVWLNSSTFEVETEYGTVNEENLENIKILLDCAARYNVKIKLCIESFRHILPGQNKWDTKASYHISNGGPFESMEDYICSERGRQEYLRRLQIIKDKVGEHPSVFAWELWNEMNAVDYPEIEEWNRYMLSQVKQMFPNTMVVQSLGSLDRMSSFPIYEFINKLPENEVMQVHRYLDEGAELPICSAPVDVFCQDAVKVLLSYGCEKPAILAESGAVQPSHAGPSLLYPQDKDGVLFHDVLFAPFFSGAAGPGHIWHWDHYLEKYGQWGVLNQFAHAVEGVDPAREHFAARSFDDGELRIYALNGEHTSLIWIRDAANTWKNEFESGIAPEIISGKSFGLSTVTLSGKARSVSFYDPWKDEWTAGSASDSVALPDFKRSIVVKVKR